MNMTQRAPLDDVVAHHVGPDQTTGHGLPFRTATVHEGLPATTYFEHSGIRRFAELHGDMCTFWLGDTLSLYQRTNEPLVDDDALGPSTDSNSGLFGEFMGALHGHDDRRHKKRQIVERTLGNGRFVADLVPYIRSLGAEYMRSVQATATDAGTFSTMLVAYVDSHIPGVLDLNDHPLTEFLTSAEHAHVASNFFEIASDVISHVNDQSLRDLDVIVPFVQDLLTSNVHSIIAAPDTNVIKAQCELWGKQFSETTIRTLTRDQLKELGTIIVAVYDTTALSLTWTIDYIENNPLIKTDLLADVQRKHSEHPISVAAQCVVESIRLGGANPTALWRRTIEPFSLMLRGRKTTVPPGTMMWLDRWEANRDPEVFPEPNSFHTQNVSHISRSNRETVSSLLSRNRYEINSFSMVNTRKNPRKCPGRLFSVQAQSTLIAELYHKYEVTLGDSDLSLLPYSSMPRPYRPGVLRITANNTLQGESAS